MARKTADRNDQLPAQFDTTNNTIQITSQVDPATLLANMQNREVNEAQLRILVHETRAELQASLEAELETLKRRGEEVVAAGAGVDAAMEEAAAEIGVQAEAALPALRALGFERMEAVVTVSGHDTAASTVELKITLKSPNSYGSMLANRTIPMPDALREAAEAHRAAQRERDLQSAVVEEWRRSLHDTARIESEGRHQLDLRIVEAADDSTARAASIEELVRKCVGRVEARAAKAKAGTKQLASPRKK